MISPNELMIGNYVKVGSNLPENIVSIEVDKIYTLPLNPKKVNSRWQLEPKDIEGIPITKEWLVNLGFKEEPTYTFSKDVIDNVLEIEFEGGNSEYSFYLINYHGNHYIELKDYKHIHQLQNLYLALTGEQLTTKEQ